MNRNAQQNPERTETEIAKLNLTFVSNAMETDPLEQDDLAGDPQTKDIQKQLFDRLRILQDEVGDTLDLESLFPF